MLSFPFTDEGTEPSGEEGIAQSHRAVDPELELGQGDQVACVSDTAGAPHRMY